MEFRENIKDTKKKVDSVLSSFRRSSPEQKELPLSYDLCEESPTWSRLWRASCKNFSDEISTPFCGTQFLTMLPCACHSLALEPNVIRAYVCARGYVCTCARSSVKTTAGTYRVSRSACNRHSNRIKAVTIAPLGSPGSSVGPSSPSGALAITCTYSYRRAASSRGRTARCT